MTPSQAKGPARLVDALGDVRTQITAIVVAIQAGSIAINQPELRAMRTEVQTIRVETQSLKADMTAQRARVDSLAHAITIIERLAKVKCRETKDFGIRTLLECAP